MKQLGTAMVTQLRLSPRHRTRPPCRGHRRRTRRTRRRRRSRSRPHPNGTRPGHRGARDPRCERPAHHQPSRDVGVDNLRQPRDRRRTSGRGRAPYARHPDYRRRRRRRKARNPTYLLGARRLGRAPEKCAVLEDAPAGIAAARAAGVTTIIGVAPSAHTFDVTICVADLRGIRYDGTRLAIPDDPVLDAHPHQPAQDSVPTNPPAQTSTSTSRNWPGHRGHDEALHCARTPQPGCEIRRRATQTCRRR